MKHWLKIVLTKPKCGIQKSNEHRKIIAKLV